MNKVVMDKLFTIGHSNYEVDKFIDLLKKNNINCVIDVRSVPFSQYATQFNKNEIHQALNNSGITYIHMGEEFGARRNNRNLYDVDGKLDFEKTARSEEFLKGVSRVKEGLSKGYNIAFMCAEKMPYDCHRCILVGKAFFDMGYDVQNILEDGSTVSQSEIGTILVNRYFPNRNQISLFTMDNPKSNEAYMQEAYKLREKEIAYSIADER